MIIDSLDIENYKQYQGAHHIEFPEQGIVAVTGPNGAGKTTLFEAIEWCLYCPRSIPQATVPPHDGVGRTLVRVTMQDPADGKRYCVERELRPSGTRAEIYLSDEQDQSIVQGTREVSRYVARHLIGLPHGAFVSTFFTKQKELQFFGDRTATERRTEVGRLLGLEAVREAQHEIGEGRSGARTRADSLREEYERRLGDRNLTDERERATNAVCEAEAVEAESAKDAHALAADAEGAQETLDRQRTRQAEDAALGLDITELTGAIGAAAARRDAAASELLRLESRAAERMELAAVAGGVEALVADVERFEQARERAGLRQSLEVTQRQAEEVAGNVCHRLERLVAQQQDAANGLSGWRWTADDCLDPVAAAERLHAIAVALDPGEQRRQVALLQEAVRLSEAGRQIAEELQRYGRLRDTLIRERDAIVSIGDPQMLLAEAARCVKEAREAENLVRAAISAARVELREVEALAAGLRQHVEEPVCPTCTRPLGRREAERLLAMLDEKTIRLTAEKRDLDGKASSASDLVREGEESLAQAQKRLEKIRELEGRLADGQALIEETEVRHTRAVTSLDDALGAIGGTAVPTPNDVVAAQRRADHAQQIAELARLLERLRDEARGASNTREQAEARLRDLGEVDYDQEAHRRAADRLATAQRAAAQVERIDIELAHRTQYEEQRASEETTIAALSARRGTLAAKRDGLAFDPAALHAAMEAERKARGAAHEARDRHIAAQQSVRDARAARERLAAEHDQLQGLIEEADRQSREADDLSRMYEEFADFDRYVARSVGPLLAETAERMLAQVTNGKYDHVQFDENYGIEVFDGDEAFPLGGFSGGERDVVALCARLALSEVVGSSALRPPRFLVLDEVFGSLDSERRTMLLETLGSLAHSGHFRQMFIISHVDDVQQSPVMNEAWTIEERDGISQVNRPESGFSAVP